MKTILLISWFLITVIVANGQTTGLKRLDRDYGIGPYKLDMKMKSIHDLTCKQNSVTLVQVCTLSNDSILKFGNINLKANKFFFFKKRLDTIHLNFDLNDSSKVVQTFTRLYGRPTKGTYFNFDNTSGVFRYWMTDKVRLQVIKDEIIISARNEKSLKIK